MKKQTIQDMFSEVVKKAAKSKERIADGSILRRITAGNVDHYTMCPFRSVDIKDCPLCKLDNLG